MLVQGSDVMNQDSEESDTLHEEDVYIPVT